MRPIDAEELLEHLEACLQNGRPLSNLYDLSEIVRYVKSMPTIAVSPWHRVEDGLPKHGQHILICLRFTNLDGEENQQKPSTGTLKTLKRKGADIGLGRMRKYRCKPV